MKIRHPDLTPNPVTAEHLELGIPLPEDAAVHPGPHPVLHLFAGLAGFIMVGVAVYLFIRLFFPNNLDGGLLSIRDALTGLPFWAASLAGFLAQAVDGALGMAYGISATTFLLGTGASPAVASASVHIAEVFTTGFSGISHVRYGNVNKSLFLRLLLPGMLGAATGAVVVTQVDAGLLRPVVSGYLLVMGGYILARSRRPRRHRAELPKHVGKLALFGGFVDAVGGGGWGPVVTTTLVGGGSDPRTTIGSVSFAEFFLTLATAASFSLLVTTTAWVTIAGLVFGGLFAAPFAAMLCRAVHARTLMAMVGIIISLLSLYNLAQALGA